MAQNSPFIEKLLAGIREKAEKEYKKANNIAYKAFFDYIEMSAREAFIRAVVHFYSGYSPKFYKRNRNLYNIIEVDRDAAGNQYIEIGFNATNVTSYRSGYIGGREGDKGSPYDIAFRKGWHGGADHISDYKADRYGVHPNPGTPYWRSPYPRYTKWGYEAAVSPSPLEEYNELFSELQKDAQGVYDKAFYGYWGNVRI